MEELEKELDEKIQTLNKNAKKKINKLVDDYEDKFFGKLNNIIKEMDDDEKKESKENKNKNEKKHKKENKQNKQNTTKNKTEENENKTKENKNKIEEKEKEEKADKPKKPSEFELFDKSIDKLGKKIDKKICEKASDLEQKLINYAKNSKARQYIKEKYTEEIDKKIFDDFFESIEENKEKGRQFIQSKKVKDKCKKIDEYLIKMSYSKKTEKIINIIDGINLKTTKEVLDEIDKIPGLLDSETKEMFRNNFKILIQEEIFLCYEKLLEPQLKELVINIGKQAFDAVDQWIDKRKKKYNKNN